ncbi:TVP38/TMEM64 family protein [Bacillus sp. PS06]|uniref:TVP38/TMEM64 family protein n=1 Tax=Bacillus sp. PS06 TaxID=2764176 RepID=UPI00177DE046|nr:VTT domain-containing protein [Bacillus sp. PS06]MBD8069268.1 TVP38/TMEM64 family protein [Bacillus sp. PS06]
MQDKLVEVLVNYKELAVVVSLLINILFSILGVIPSVFITAANLLVFGYWKGTIISFLGETIGAIVSFWLYRKGFKRYMGKKLDRYPLVSKLLGTKGKDAFILILSMRLFPFAPSGLVTFASAIGEVSLIVFLFASIIGKIPALLMEAYSVNQVTNWTTEGKLIIVILSIVGLIYCMRKISKN